MIRFEKNNLHSFEAVLYCFRGSKIMSHDQNENFMKHYELNQPVGNLKTNKLGKIASAYFKANSGDFNGYVVLTEGYGYEIWDDSTVIALPPDFTHSAPLPPV
jgi:hypothetical protein